MSRRTVKKLNKKSLLDKTIKPKKIITNYDNGEIISQGEIVIIDGREYVEYANSRGQIYRELL